MNVDHIGTVSSLKEDPGHQLIFVPEVIVKCRALDLRSLTDLRDPDLVLPPFQPPMRYRKQIM